MQEKSEKNWEKRYYCYCGRKLRLPPKDWNFTSPYFYYCKCGRKWIWKIRSRKYVFAGGGDNITRILCVKCSVENGMEVFYMPKKTGVKVRYGYYSGYFHADLYECPICGNLVITGFGDAEIFDPEAHVEYDFSRRKKGSE